MSIAVVVLTYNRVYLLKQCVENVLDRASERTTEIVIWNNGSTDGTSELPRLAEATIVFASFTGQKNIGQNAYDRAFEQTKAHYLIELDDDIDRRPGGWDATLLDSFLQVKTFGYLAANLVNNPNDATAQIMYGKNAHMYQLEEINGVRIKMGPTGGGCSLTSREIYDKVGGFGENRKSVFWLEDEQYIGKVMKLGLRAGYLNDLEVLHAGGEYYATVGNEKRRYWTNVRKRVKRKDAIKRCILSIPFARRLNEKYDWFVPPDQPWRVTRS